jgi:hypothetical protein
MQFLCAQDQKTKNQKGTFLVLANIVPWTPQHINVCLCTVPCQKDLAHFVEN